MPRIARIIIPGLPHHVTQRGNNRQDVFFTDDDRRIYLELLQEESTRNGLRLGGYCLMSNHVHILAIPDSDDSLSRAIGRTDFRYTQILNRLHKRSGHLWQNRFYSCPVHPQGTSAVLRYMELNPVRAKMVRRAWKYRWSSAEEHLGGAGNGLMLDPWMWTHWIGMSGDQWRDWLMLGSPQEEIERIRLHTHRGRPLGTDAFLAKIESRLGRRLRPLPVGRPKRKDEKK